MRLVVLALLAVATPAAAQPSVTPPVTDSDVSDAANGRAYLSPTAFTGPRGSWTVDLRVPVLPVAGLATLGYAAADWLEVSAGGAGLYDEYASDLDVVGALKARILRSGTFALAFQAAVAVETRFDHDVFWVGTLVGTKVLDRTAVSLSVSLLPVDDPGSETPEGTPRPAVGASVVTGARWKLVVDAFALERGSNYRLGGYAGVRYARPRYSFDLGLAGDVSKYDSEIIPLPLAGISARF